MGGGDHDPGVGLETAYREGEHRGGTVPVEEEGPPARAGDHCGGVTGELGRVVPRVVADDHRETIPQGLAEVGAQPGGRPDDGDPVHAVRPGSEAPAQSGGAKAQGAAEGLLQGGRGLGLPSLVAGQENGELGTGDLVGILGHPCARGTGELGGLSRQDEGWGHTGTVPGPKPGIQVS